MTSTSLDGPAEITTESHSNTQSPKKETKGQSIVLFYTVVGLVILFVFLSLIFTIVKCGGEQRFLRNQQRDEYTI